MSSYRWASTGWGAPRSPFLSSVRAGIISFWSGLRHLFKPRMTLRYPEQKLELEGPGYQFDAKTGTGRPGFKGRHLLIEDKCTGCQLCAIACDGIAVAIEMQELKLDRVHNKKNIWPAVDYGRCVFCGLCISPETPVMTNPGLKQISEITIGDLLLTHTGDYKPVTKVWDMQYTGPLYKIFVYGKPEPLVCTSDHPVLAVSRPVSNRKDRRLLRSTQPLGFFKPGQLKKGDYLVGPIVKKEVSTRVYERIVPMYRGGVAKRSLSLEASPDLFRLIGYYVAEGSCDGGRRVNFDFSETETKTFVLDCSNLVKTFFGKECVLRRNGEHGVRLVLNSAVAEDFFSQFGTGAPNKKLPGWVFFAEGEKQLELLKGEWQGDGCTINQKRQKYLNISTTSKTLAYQLQSVYARLGIIATIDSEKPENRLRSYHVNVFGRWAIKLAGMWNVPFQYEPSKSTSQFQIDNDYVYMPIRRIEVENVESYRVMDVTVDQDHTFSPLGLATSNCVDACPFDALVMTNEFELAAYDRESLKYTPEMLFLPGRPTGKYKAVFDTEKGNVTHG